ncbi:MAG: carboxylate-amine ligase [Proteobacteria bacterium]|nr:carboxylate-amine ligase [Pseudomonadota bacterium]
MLKKPSFTLGIEEEYMLVHPETGDLVREAPESLMPAMREKLGDQVTPEFLQCQVEVGTRVCQNVSEAREDLSRLRKNVAAVAADHGFGLIASSTHPFAEADQQMVTSRERYATLENDLQRVARRLLISGMHVHVGIDDDDARIDLMSQAAYILPHILALSTSSPFWRSEDTGLMSYRICIWDEMPRTGLPREFESHSEYMRHVQTLVDAGIIEDASKIWWDLRPSCRFPTLEMRISDLCTTLEDTLCIAALYSCWLSMLHRLRLKNLRWRRYSSMLIEENRWRAHRYGTKEGLIDFGRGRVISYADLIDEIIELVAEDAAALDCEKEINHARTILERGTSAHRQLSIYNTAMQETGDSQQAFKQVVDWLREETLNF